ncbi:hypothetical protein [Methylobacterium goesingense]|uniref:Uncharacterized protein n=1 Tax=Methylobacterium goesingense TaxID=243690 RepID=A0ABV2L6N0_9HYPH|nr:hypothetical protein [Methylobacterium goesingense]
MNRQFVTINLVFKLMQLTEHAGAKVFVSPGRGPRVKDLAKLLIKNGIEPIFIKSASESQAQWSSNTQARGLIILEDNPEECHRQLTTSCPAMASVGALYIGEEQVRLTTEGNLASVQVLKFVEPSLAQDNIRIS